MTTTYDLVAFYSQRYKYSYLLQWILAADRMALEAARDAYWYTTGRYEATGHDRAGIAYVQYTETERELDDLLEDEMEREASKYGEVWGE